MKNDYPPLKLDPEFVAMVRERTECRDGHEPLFERDPSREAKGIAQTIQNSCPRMAGTLEAAGILERFAEILHGEILKLAGDFCKSRRLSPSEAESEARKELIPWCWEMQEEWLAAYCVDWEPEPDPDLYGPDDPRHSQYRESEEDDESGIPQLRFEPGEAFVVQGKLVNAIQAILQNRSLTSAQLMNLGAFLWLVERLPEHHIGYFGQIDLTSDHGDGAGWRSVTISEDGLALDEGEIIRGDCGTDHESKTVFRVSETCGSDSEPYFDLEEWLRYFANDAGDPDVEFSVDWYPDGEMPTCEEITMNDKRPPAYSSSLSRQCFSNPIPGSE
jgi:hypothetical protein